MNFKSFYLTENEKAEWLGSCINFRRKSTQNEQIWQNIMTTKKKISEKEFLKNVEIDNLLDAGETWKDWKENNSDDSIHLYKSGNYYFVQTKGFEFLWRKELEESFYLTESLQTVYHALNLLELFGILKNDSLEFTPNVSKVETPLGNKKYYFLSTMRNKSGTYFLGISKSTNLPMKDAYIELDYDYLKNNLTSAPVDYWQAGRKASEEEERFWSNEDKITNVGKFIKGIHIFIRQDLDEKQTEYFRQKMINIWYAARVKKIPIFFYDKPQNFVTGKKPIDINFENEYPTERPKSKYTTKELEVLIKLMNDEKLSGDDVKKLKDWLRYSIYHQDFINTVTQQLHGGRKDAVDEYRRNLLSTFINVMKKAKSKSVSEFIEKSVMDKMKERKLFT